MTKTKIIKISQERQRKEEKKMLNPKSELTFSLGYSDGCLWYETLRCYK